MYGRMEWLTGTDVHSKKPRGLLCRPSHHVERSEERSDGLVVMEVEDKEGWN